MALQTESLKKLLEDEWVFVTYDIKGRFYADEQEEQDRIATEIALGAIYFVILSFKFKFIIF